MTEIVAADIGGTHARFALAEISDGTVAGLSGIVSIRTAEHASLATAWETFGACIGRPLPRAAAIAVAGPVIPGEGILKLTNNPWLIRPEFFDSTLKLDRHVLLNDFGAVGHAIARMGAEHMRPLCGPNTALPAEGTISIVGPGTGLGVAHIHRLADRYTVIETEGGHMDFAPLDTIEDAILKRLRERHVRVSAERVASGPGLRAIYETLADIEGRPTAAYTDNELWSAGLSGTDQLAVATLDRFCLILGAVAGDIVLAQGGKALVIAGGLGLRLADYLPRSGFAARFAAKGRFQNMMSNIPVKLIVHAEPGLYGAAAAFAQVHCR
jgi:glucokinase